MATGVLSSEKFQPGREADHCPYGANLKVSRAMFPPSPYTHTHTNTHRGADKSLARPTSRYILFDGENISFDASLVIYI